MTRADETGTFAGAAAALRRGRLADLALALPTWATVLAVWTAGRALSTIWLALAYPLAARALPENALWGNGDGFFRFLSAWDGQYYEQISLHGYPSVLPLDQEGHVAQNAWAFLPAFPFLIRSLTASTGLPFEVGAVAVSTVAGLLAAFLLHRLVQEHAGAQAAFWATFFFCVGPLSFLLQVGYAESLFLALVFGALLAIERRRYGLLTVLGVAAAFTRPGALAVPLVLGVVAVVRYARHRSSVRGVAVAGGAAAAGSAAAPGGAAGVGGGAAAGAGRFESAAGDGGAVPAGLLARVTARLGGLGRRLPERFPVRERIAIVVSAALMVTAGLSWPVIAAHVTGRPDAYLATEMSWWVNFIGRVHFVPLSPWFLNAGRWLGVGGIVLVLLIIAGFVVWMSRRSTHRLGFVPLTFVAAYALYVFAVSLPMASTPRLLMPVAPLFGSPELVSRPWSRAVLVGGALVGQPVCVAVLWLLGPP